MKRKTTHQDQLDTVRSMANLDRCVLALNRKTDGETMVAVANIKGRPEWP